MDFLIFNCYGESIIGLIQKKVKGIKSSDIRPLTLNLRLKD